VGEVLHQTGGGVGGRAAAEGVKMVLRYRPPRFIEFFSGNVKARRQRFLQKYGYPHSDKRKVDEKIVALLEEASLSLSNKEEVCIPIELVLALTLREGFARSPGRAWRGQADEGRLSNSRVWRGLTRGLFPRNNPLQRGYGQQSRLFMDSKNPCNARFHTGTFSLDHLVGSYL